MTFYTNKSSGGGIIISPVRCSYSNDNSLNIFSIRFSKLIKSKANTPIEHSIFPFAPCSPPCWCSSSGKFCAETKERLLLPRNTVFTVASTVNEVKINNKKIAFPLIQCKNNIFLPFRQALQTIRLHYKLILLYLRLLTFIQHLLMQDGLFNNYFYI